MDVAWRGLSGCCLKGVEWRYLVETLLVQVFVYLGLFVALL